MYVCMCLCFGQWHGFVTGLCVCEKCVQRFCYVSFCFNFCVRLLWPLQQNERNMCILVPFCVKLGLCTTAARMVGGYVCTRY
jgi:hypothetical protein